MGKSKVFQDECLAQSQDLYLQLLWSGLTSLSNKGYKLSEKGAELHILILGVFDSEWLPNT